MRTHDHDVEGSRELRLKPARLDLADAGLAYRAAAGGRTDVLGPAGLLDLLRAVGNRGVGAVVSEEQRSPVLDLVDSGGGSPLDAETRADMESRLGHDPSDRFEREATVNAQRAMSAPAPAAVSPAGPSLQRQAVEEEQPEEDAVQGTFVQRQEGEEEQEAPAE
jgi:hypothetical protein